MSQRECAVVAMLLATALQPMASAARQSEFEPPRRAGGGPERQEGGGLRAVTPIEEAGDGGASVARSQEEPAEGRETARLASSRVEARVFGGGRLLRGGEVNEAVANTSRFTVSSLYEFEEIVTLEDGDAPAARHAGEHGAEVLVRLTPRFGVVGGLVRIESSGAGRWIETPSARALYPSRSAASLDLRAVALKFGGEYAYPLSGRLSLAMGGGAGLYFTQLRWTQQAEVDFIATTTSDVVTDVRGYGLGFHGGVSLAVELSGRLGLVIGVQGVHADIGSLEGARESTHTGFSHREGRTVTRSTSEAGTLAVLEFGDAPIGGVLGFVEDRAVWVERYGPIVESVREAAVGLGGLRFTGGLRIGF